MTIDIKGMAAEVAQALREQVRAATRKLDERLAQVEQQRAAEQELVRDLLARLDAHAARIEELERNPLEFRGTWKPGSTFARRSLITDHGSLWICLRDTDTRPGESGDWQLVAKKGRDSRDTREVREQP